VERTSVDEIDDLVPRSGTFLCSMQGGENWSVTLKGMSFPWVKVCQVAAVCKVDFCRCHGQKLA
jgi:hypothetical protein